MVPHCIGLNFFSRFSLLMNSCFIVQGGLKRHEQKCTHYPNTVSHPDLVPLRSILITEPIREAVVKFCPENKDSNSLLAGFQQDSGAQGLPLAKMSGMLDAFEQGVSLEPIEVRIREGFLYSIVQGRHRVAASIIAGYTHIAVVYLE